MEIALSKANIRKAALADAGALFIGCARLLPDNQAERRDSLVKQSERLFQISMQSDEPKDYVLFQWARAKAGMADYRGAWDKIKELKRITGKAPPEEFVRRLQQQMPEPRD